MSEFEYPKAILLNSNASGSADGQIDYWGLFHKFILSRWYLYLVFGIVFIGLAYVFYKKQPPVYEITSKVLIREREQGAGPAEDIVKNNINFSAASENATNEIEMLTSFSLMHSIVQEMQLEKRYFWKHKLAERDAYENFPIAVDSFSLKSTANNTFEITPFNQYTFRFSGGADSEVHNFGELFTNQYGTFRFSSKGVHVTTSDSTMHVAFVDTRQLTRDYLDNLSVELSDEKNKSSVVVLSIQDAVPQRGIDILNRLVGKFDQIKSESNAEITLKTLELIDSRLATIGSELSFAESTVESYKLNNEIISETTSDLNFTLEDVNRLVRERRGIELQIEMLQAMKSDLRDSATQFKLIPINPALYDGKIRDLVQPYNDAVIERERLLLKGQNSNPVVQANDQRLKSLRSSINTAIDHMQDDLGLQISKLQEQYDKSSNRLRSVPSKERGLTDKLRIQSIKEDLYVYLLQKREETALALVSDYTNALLIDPPYSSLDPVAPSKVKIFLGAAMGGAAIPFFLILLLDLFSNSVRSEKDVKEILPERTILGSINYQKGKDLSLLKQQQSLMNERFRSLRTNLRFHYREKSKCILVTSSTSNEGKTFVATNLATSLALIKKKTIVVDFDLRRPSVNKFFKGNAEVGLSNFFLEELGVDEIIQHSIDLPNLHFISSGPVIANLTELITDKQLTIFFSYLREIYDIIIIDSSPIGMTADSILLNNYVDNSLFVVRSRYTKKAMVEKAKEIFDQNKLVNPSIVINGIKKQNDAYGYSYERYGYA